MPLRYRPYTPRPRRVNPDIISDSSSSSSSQPQENSQSQETPSDSTSNHQNSDSTSNHTNDNMSTGGEQQDIPQGAQAPNPEDILNDDFSEIDSNPNPNIHETLHEFETNFFDKFSKLFEAKANINKVKQINVRANTPAPFAVKSTELSQVYNTDTHLQSQTDSLNTDLGIINAIEHIANGEPQDSLSILNILKTKIIEKNELVKSQAQQVRHTFEVANFYKPSINRPTEFPDPHDIIPDVTIELLKTKNVLKAIKVFNPDKPNSDFCEHWRQIMSYTRKHFLSEEQYLDILGLTLYGPALRVFDDLMPSSPSLNTVLDRLVQLYGSKRTILDDQKELSNFTRKPNEDIKTAICRARCLNERLKPLYPKDSWIDTSNRTLKQILKSILLSQTKAHLECEELKCLKVGASMDLDSMIDLVDTYEISHKLVPTSDTGNDAKTTPIQSNVMESSIETHYEINSAVHRSNMAKRSRPFKPYSTSQRAQAIRTIPNVTKQDTTMSTLTKPSIYPLTQIPIPSSTQQTTQNSQSQGPQSQQNRSTYGSQSQSQASTSSQQTYGQTYKPGTQYNRIYGQSQSSSSPQSYSSSTPSYRPYISYRGRYQGSQRYQGPQRYQGQQRYSRPQYGSQRPAYNSNLNYHQRAQMRPRNADGQDQRILVTINENPYYMCKCHSMHLTSVTCPLEKDELPSS